MPLLLNSFLLGNKPPEPPQRHSRAPARLTGTPLGLEDSRKGAERGGGRPLPIRFQHHFSLPSICTSDSSLISLLLSPIACFSTRLPGLHLSGTRVRRLGDQVGESKEE